MIGGIPIGFGNGKFWRQNHIMGKDVDIGRVIITRKTS